MTIKDAVEKAGFTGWRFRGGLVFCGVGHDGLYEFQGPGVLYLAQPEQILLDPSFWQSLGDALGWDHDDWRLVVGDYADQMVQRWEAEWVRFIHYLASGRAVETFFATLI